MLHTPSSTNFEIVHRTSSALDHLAGPWSQSIAEQVPFPHSDFLERPSAWMHVIGLILANPISSNNNIRVVLENVKDWRDAAFVGSPNFLAADAVCLLKKLTLPLWDRDDYRRFTSLLDCRLSVKLMKHEPAVTPELVNLLAALPEQFRTKKIVGFLLNTAEGNLINQLFKTRTKADVTSVKNALESCPDRQHFWRKVTDHFFSEIGTLPVGPVINDDRFQPIQTIRDLEKTGLRFRNCMKQFSVNMINNELGFLVFSGSEDAVISYQPRIDRGFVVDEILGPENQAVSEETIEEIRTVLTAHGFAFSDTDPGSLYQKIDLQLSRLGREDRPDCAFKIASKALEKVDLLNR